MKVVFVILVVFFTAVYPVESRADPGTRVGKVKHHAIRRQVKHKHHSFLHHLLHGRGSRHHHPHHGHHHHHHHPHHHHPHHNPFKNHFHPHKHHFHIHPHRHQPQIHHAHRFQHRHNLHLSPHRHIFRTTLRHPFHRHPRKHHSISYFRHSSHKHPKKYHLHHHRKLKSKLGYSGHLHGLHPQLNRHVQVKDFETVKRDSLPELLTNLGHHLLKLGNSLGPKTFTTSKRVANSRGSDSRPPLFAENRTFYQLDGRGEVRHGIPEPISPALLATNTTNRTTSEEDAMESMENSPGNENGDEPAGSGNLGDHVDSELGHPPEDTSSTSDASYSDMEHPVGTSASSLTNSSNPNGFNEPGMPRSKGSPVLKEQEESEEQNIRYIKAPANPVSTDSDASRSTSNENEIPGSGDSDDLGEADEKDKLDGMDSEERKSNVNKQGKLSGTRSKGKVDMPIKTESVIKEHQSMTDGLNEPSLEKSQSKTAEAKEEGLNFAHRGRKSPTSEEPDHEKQVATDIAEQNVNEKRPLYKMSDSFFQENEHPVDDPKGISQNPGLQRNMIITDDVPQSGHIVNKEAIENNRHHHDDLHKTLRIPNEDNKRKMTKNNDKQIVSKETPNQDFPATSKDSETREPSNDETEEPTLTQSTGYEGFPRAPMKKEPSIKRREYAFDKARKPGSKNSLHQFTTAKRERNEGISTEKEVSLDKPGPLGKNENPDQDITVTNEDQQVQVTANNSGIQSSEDSLHQPGKPVVASSMSGPTINQDTDDDSTASPSFNETTIDEQTDLIDNLDRDLVVKQKESQDRDAGKSLMTDSRLTPGASGTSATKQWNLVRNEGNQTIGSDNDATFQTGKAATEDFEEPASKGNPDKEHALKQLVKKSSNHDDDKVSSQYGKANLSEVPHKNSDVKQGNYQVSRVDEDVFQLPGEYEKTVPTIAAAQTKIKDGNQGVGIQARKSPFDGNPDEEVEVMNEKSQGDERQRKAFMQSINQTSDQSENVDLVNSLDQTTTNKGEVPQVMVSRRKGPLQSDRSSIDETERSYSSETPASDRVIPSEPVVDDFKKSALGQNVGQSATVETRQRSYNEQASQLSIDTPAQSHENGLQFGGGSTRLGAVQRDFLNKTDQSNFYEPYQPPVASFSQPSTPDIATPSPINQAALDDSFQPVARKNIDQSPQDDRETPLLSNTSITPDDVQGSSLSRPSDDDSPVEESVSLSSPYSVSALTMPSDSPALPERFDSFTSSEFPSTDIPTPPTPRVGNQRDMLDDPVEESLDVSVANLKH